MAKAVEPVIVKPSYASIVKKKGMIKALNGPCKVQVCIPNLKHPRLVVVPVKGNYKAKSISIQLITHFNNLFIKAIARVSIPTKMDGFL